MHLIVIGAGPVGEYFVRLAEEGGHNVALVESGEARAEHCAQNYDARVLHATIGEEGILEEAGAQQADALIATTEDDSVNLMSVVLGQEYGIENLTSTVNSRHRAGLFERLRVNTLVDPEILAARHLMDMVLHSDSEAVTSIAGYGEIYELQLGSDSDFVQRSICELRDDDSLPDGCGIVLIVREEEHMFPRDDTRLEVDDTLLVFSPDPLKSSDLKRFAGTQE